MNTSTRALILGTCGFLTSATLFSYKADVLPGRTGALGTIGSNLAVSGGCGSCHQGGNAQNMHVELMPDQKSLRVGQPVSVTTSWTGGLPTQLAGFQSWCSAGRFIPGLRSVVDPSGQTISHKGIQINPGQHFIYTYDPPSTPGIYQLYTAVCSVDNDGTAAGDVWTFHNPPGRSQTPSTWVHIIVNSPGIAGYGKPCIAQHGNYPVLGAIAPPSVGNSTFQLQVGQAAEQSWVHLVVGVTRQNIDLSPIGATGCTLLLDPLVFLNRRTRTSRSPAGLGGSGGQVLFPIPNDPALKGSRLLVQAMINDIHVNRAIPMSFTNGLDITIQ